MKTIWRIITCLIAVAFWAGIIIGLMIGSALHADAQPKQRFALIYLYAPGSVGVTLDHVEFASFDLCDSARKRMLEEFGDNAHGICVPTEEKHK